ncbi:MULTISPECIES: DivIVA-like cell division protein Wag31 [Pseudonocardia]|uniref:Cell wall synthesis protein Wag31 n=2 Tax=Pseudonocardia TaxID=1847 RepID=A0A1Y2MRI8_PSEAH|nr:MULTISPECIES: DivIVA domain-containing protein [Pseudonocardia]OSY37337.1 Cell wall synthesis protein Wag31 [Pseudonocardia autotrophica]TDN72366.1 DivIVA domain-containing protein [Pseudonocardia autotrophica]BBG03076.1 cell division initiation protein [Pseudonocardia autotrophica]GEC23696.1 cell division initiation protein [Pseudonocardia saturnea]
MPLTPADVHNVAFSKPPIGKRGYNEDEVDAFLDLVEAELARLIGENDDLRDQVAQLEQRLGDAEADLDEARNQPAPAQTQALQASPSPLGRGGGAPAPQLAGVGGSADADGGDHHVQAAKVLGLAQEMADRLTAEAKNEADTMLSDARTKSEQLLSDARTKADGLVNDARSRAETMLNDARTRSETLERQSRDKASGLVSDAERKQNEIMGAIQRDKSVLEKKIDELRTFEREYRTRLKTYLESQLRDLEGRGSAAPTDNSANANRSGSNGGYAASGYGQRADTGS